MFDPQSLVPDGTIASVQFDDWFFAPDGQQYRVAHGPITIIKAEKLFGFQPKNSTNWYAQVGYGERGVLLAGCRIHSAILGQKRPHGPHVYDAREVAL